MGHDVAHTGCIVILSRKFLKMRIKLSPEVLFKPPAGSNNEYPPEKSAYCHTNCNGNDGKPHAPDKLGVGCTSGKAVYQFSENLRNKKLQTIYANQGKNASSKGFFVFEYPRIEVSQAGSVKFWPASVALTAQKTPPKTA